MVKQTIKLLGGMFSTVIGTVGVVLSGFFLMQIRETAHELEREVPQTLGHAVHIAESVREQGEVTTKILQTTRERVDYLGTTIESLSTKLSQRDNRSSLLTVIDEDIDLQLDNAKQFVLSMQTSMRNLGNTLLVFDSMSLLGTRPMSLSDDASLSSEHPLKTVAVGLRQTADLLDQVTLGITKLQSGESISPRQLLRIQYTLQQVDRELVRIKSEVKTFSDEVAKTERKLKNLKAEAPIWIGEISQMASLFLICFGASQLMLGLHGLRLVNEARAHWGELRRKRTEPE